MDADATARWEDVFDRHQTLIEQHGNFLSALRANPQAHAGETAVLQPFLEHTEAMMKTSQELAAKFLSTNRSGCAPTPQMQQSGNSRQMRVPTGPRLDPSGLFMTDTTPTPLEDLLRRPTTSAVIRTKRKASEVDEKVLTTALPKDERPPKKARTEEVPAVMDEVIEQGEVNGTKDVNAEDSIHIPAMGDSFVQEVEELLKKKQLKRVKRQEKKRKRTSGLSDVSMSGTGQDNTTVASSTEIPSKKKRRKDTANPTSGAESVSQSTSPSGRTTPRIEKGRRKRPSPAAEYVRGILKQVQERGRSKRQKTAGS